MSDQSDKQLIWQTHSDVKWIKDTMEKGEQRAEKLEGRVAKVERNQWYASGALAAVLMVWEAAKDKLFK